jgi:hypothetical protein
MAPAITALFDDEARRNQFGCNGWRFAETMTWENTSTQFLKLLS